jgi:hypothetical protein
MHIGVNKAQHISCSARFLFSVDDGYGSGIQADSKSGDSVLQEDSVYRRFLN